MNFDFSEEQKLLQHTAREFLAQRSPLSADRQVLESGASHDAELWKGVAEMGWLGAAVPEALGGSGFGPLELVLIANEVGRALAPIPFASSVYLTTEALLLAGSPEQQREQLPKLASGDRIGAFALTERPGDPDASTLETRLERGRLHGTKIAVADGRAANLAVVVTRSEGDVELALVDLDGEGVERTPVESIDPAHGCVTLRFEGAPAEALAAARGWDAVSSLLDRAAVLLAFEQLGGAERAFELTRDFTLSRYAFGRPVASFQALKHRMADLYCALELARSNAYYGAWALSENAPELRVAACSSRVSATQAFDLASEEMVQMYGGVGFTWEYDCHLFYRRARHQAVALGSIGYWRDLLVSRLAESD